MKILCLFFLAATPVLISPNNVRSAEYRKPVEEDVGWPRSYSVENAEIILDQPQVEKWEESVLEARFVVSIKTPGNNRPFLGSFLARAETQTNSETRTVTIYNISAHDVQFPDAVGKNEEFTRLINALAPEKPVKASLDTLLASVPSDNIVTKNTVLTTTQNKAPRIFVSNTPAVLLAFDGPPIFRPISGSGLEAAVNTPATVLRMADRKTPVYLLTNEGIWLTAATVEGPWRQAGEAPLGLERIPADHPVAKAVKSVTPPPGSVISVPEVVISNEPAEIIQIDGKPNYQRIGELPLVRVGNTDSTLFYHFDLSTFYVLISGRWFSAQELKGPWVYVPNNALPDEFSLIPTNDRSAVVRVSVAGTREAEEAVKEAQISTIARVNIREAPTIEVDYDGEPIFEEISGTELYYATNTSYEVIRVSGSYYCCHDGLWFVSDRSYGSRWRCATSLPRVIFTIPPSCPLYHTRFCDIDSFDNDVVVYRYNSGYYGTYIDPVSHVCIYGTGYRYQPYVSDNYYTGHSWTYGLGSTYVPQQGFVYESRHVASTNWNYQERRNDHREPESWHVSSGSHGLQTHEGKWQTTAPQAAPYARWDRGVTAKHDEIINHLVQKIPVKDQPRVVSHGLTDERVANTFKKDLQESSVKQFTRENRDEMHRKNLPDKVKKIAPSDPRHRVDEPPIAGKISEQHKGKPDAGNLPPQTTRQIEPRPQIPPREERQPNHTGKPGEIPRTGVVEPGDGKRGHIEKSIDDVKPIEKKVIPPKAIDVENPRHNPRDSAKDIKKEQPRVVQDPPPIIKKEPPQEIRRPHIDPPPVIKREEPRTPRPVQIDPPPVAKKEQPQEIRRPHIDPPPVIKKEEPRAPRPVQIEQPPVTRREQPREIRRVPVEQPPVIRQPEPQPQPREQRRVQIDPPPVIRQPQPRVDVLPPTRVDPRTQSHGNKRDDKKDDKKDDILGR